MRLPRPFYRLPLQFDAERMRAEVSALPASAWALHPNHISGNSSIRLISVNGGENDDVDGPMHATAHLEKSPYLKQVLASFGVVWSRSRLLRLAPGASVPEHADINYHWFNRVRLHIPIVTRPEVRFVCGDESVHMQAGEPWLFDNWRLHRVENPTADERIHLVADTSGSASFWQLVARGDADPARVHVYEFQPGETRPVLTERSTLADVMTPAEVELLVLDLRAELVPISDSNELSARLKHYHAVLDGFCRDWRQLYALYGSEGEGRSEFTKLRDSMRETSRTLAEGIVMRTNRIAAHKVLEGRVLRPMLPERVVVPSSSPVLPERSRLRAPIFIIAAPRSGSTLLFETLAMSRTLFTLGGEAHELIEGNPELRPGAPGVTSNRLEASHLRPALANQIIEQMFRDMRDSSGRPPNPAQPVRLLEKTPKNSLRIPFLDALFPDARYIFLWRDPRESLGSIMEAWRSGRWRTYNGLPGFQGPWSLLLPPGWEEMNGRPLEEIAAFQWDATHRIVLRDLQKIPRERWTTVTYSDLTRAPDATIRRLAAFAGIEFDANLAEHVAKPLPPSRYTLTPPDSDKWKRDEPSIKQVLPTVEETWVRLQALSSSQDFSGIRTS